MLEENKQDGLPIAPLSMVHRSLGTPSDQLLLPHDMYYLQFYRYALPDLGCIFIQRHSIRYICRPDFDIPSIPFRAAVLAFATLSMPKERNANTNPDTN